MTREEFESFVLDNYNVRADYPFEEDLVTGAFRHESGKWFALAMRISERKLGRDSDASIDVVNLKCAPDVAESLVGVERGVYPAYHMNKLHWITVVLCECDTEILAWLLDGSYELTRTKIKRK